MFVRPNEKIKNITAAVATYNANMKFRMCSYLHSYCNVSDFRDFCKDEHYVAHIVYLLAA